MRARRDSTVIVVDDDRSVRTALQRLIRAAGHEVQCLSSGTAYLEHPVAPSPACLVLDVRMPGMTGFELQAVIAGTPRALPIVFITGHGEDEVRRLAGGSESAEVLYKPPDEASLLSAIDRAIAKSRAGS
jgi:FixJ family two-component response regulator